MEDCPWTKKTVALLKEHGEQVKYVELNAEWQRQSEYLGSVAKELQKESFELDCQHKKDLAERICENESSIKYAI